MVRTFRALWVLLLLTLVGILGTASVSANGQDDPPGNNGTLKVHERGTPSDTESNDPKVCEFNFEGFGFDEGQTGYIVIEEQSGPDFMSEQISFGPVNAKGYAETEYFNGEGEVSIPDGHYKVTLYGKDNPDGPFVDQKAKSKVFKVECEAVIPPEEETPTPTPTPEITPTPEVTPTPVASTPQAATPTPVQRTTTVLPDTAVPAVAINPLALLISLTAGASVFYIWMGLGNPHGR